MVFCKSTKNAKSYNSIAEIPKKIWQELGCEENLYLSPAYLSAIANNHSDIDFNYLILNNENGSPIAFATIQLVNFHLDSVKNEMQSLAEKLKSFGKKLRIINTEKTSKMLICGNAFVSGEHGLFIKNDQDKKKVIKEIARAVHQYANSTDNLKNEVALYVLKDFEIKTLNITNELHDYNFYSFQVEPNMQLKIRENWQSFQDYLNDMRTKCRGKAKKAMQLSSELKVVEITSENIENYLSKMTELYKLVSSSSGFNLGNFNLQTYQELKENLGENYIVNGYFLEDKLIGFLSAMHNNTDLDAHFVGIDYTLNRKYAIYQRMLYDYIDLGIQRKCRIINFGRTASEIKSSIGAIPQDLTVYLRHKKSIPNKILKPFLKRISPTEFRESNVFKEI